MDRPLPTGAMVEKQLPEAVTVVTVTYAPLAMVAMAASPQQRADEVVMPLVEILVSVAPAVKVTH